MVRRGGVVSILVILTLLSSFLAIESQAKKVKKNKSKKKNDSTSRSFFFVGKLDATSSCIEYHSSIEGCESRD